MPRSQADGKTRTVILTDEPADPENPTAAELLAGIYISCDILDSDFTFGATDSDKFAEKAQCEVNNTNALGASNFEAGITVFRDFGAAGIPGPDDDVFTATKAKGTELWMYSRRTSKGSKEAFAASDEIYLGAKVITDEPQPPSERGGYIKWRIPMEVVEAYPWISVAA
jgi:hypothetical protein